MPIKSLFKGSAVALITPFKDGMTDYQALSRLIEFQIKEGTDAIVTLGTTGEPATMTEKEKTEIIKFTVSKVNKRVPVIVGTGCNCTQKAIENSLEAKKLGADGLLLVTPYYNKCTQNGLIRHFNQIADSAKLPCILYNVPSRTGVNILPSTLAELCKNPYIYGIKEASGNFEQICETISVCLKGGIEFYSGDDGVTFPTMAMGGSGVISVTANIIPGFMKELTSAALKGDYKTARDMHFKLLPLAKACFTEVNPIPVKAAAEIMGLCGGELRMPLTEIEPQNREKLVAALKAFGIKI
jgi:4-hydroxy-tetrahydrodipicolinate synthase